MDKNQNYSITVPTFSECQKYENDIYTIISHLNPEVQRLIIYNVSMFVRLKLQEYVSQLANSSGDKPSTTETDTLTVSGQRLPYTRGPVIHMPEHSVLDGIAH